MKLKNVVVGTSIQAKRNTRGECGEIIKKGIVLKVTEVLREHSDDLYRVRGDHVDLEDGFAWVNPADFRKYTEVVAEPIEDTTEQPAEPDVVPKPVTKPEISPQVGDWVIGVADADSNIHQGVAYQVVGFSNLTGRVGIALHTSSEPQWQGLYYIDKADYSKVLREVQPNADTPT